MNILNKVLPSFMYEGLLSAYKRLNKNKFLYWEGNYSDWQEANAFCKGYDASVVLDQVKTSALKVKNGEAAFERDGVLFYKEEYSKELVDCLLKVSTERNGKLSLLDFGGSLGSSYFQNKKMFGKLVSLTWCVVEQKHFVDDGKSMFEDDVLKFEYTFEEAVSKYHPDVLLLGSVLQYLPDPYGWLKKFMEKKFRYILIERTPFISGAEDRLTIQHVPEKIYKASYPAWFFSEQKFLACMMKEYKIISVYTSDDKANIPSEFKGFFFKLK